MHCKAEKQFLFMILFFISPQISASPLHAQCRLEWTFGVSCLNVCSALVHQILLWSTEDNCRHGGEKCLYDLKSADERFIVAKHTNRHFGYVDDLTFKLIPQEPINACHVSAFSVSEPWYIVQDYGINYCNLRNLAEGSSLINIPGFTESTNDFKCTQYSSANCTIY